MTVRGRDALLTLICGVSLSLAGCTSSGADDPPDDRTVTLTKPASTPIVLDGATPEAVAAQASAALVAASPAVVLAQAETAGQGARAAAEAGIPLLLVGDQATAGATGDSTAIGGGADPVAAEVKRLGASQALALGAEAEAAATAMGGLRVVSKASGLPKITKAKAAAATALLTTAAIPADPEPSAGTTEDGLRAETGTAEPGASARATDLDADADADAVAASATATAIGATVVSAPTGDPRASTSSVEAIAKAKPTKVVAVGTAFGNPDLLAERMASARTGALLPGGGQTIAADKVYVAMYGHPGSRALGILGEQDLDASVERAKKLTEPYTKLTDKKVVPTFEVITTVATAGPTEDGDYSREIEPDAIRAWVERAEKEGIYVMLDLQPGTDDLLEQAQRYESLLTHPNVGLAIDPEWKLKPGTIHNTIGQVDAAEVNRVSDWLARLTKEKSLPQKALIVHQFQTRMIVNRESLNTSYDELQVIVHVDGSGAPSAKSETYGVITRNPPPNVVWGWKNFYDEDTPMLSPEQTMKQTPTPTMISYQ